jgi:two-component system, NtrC family, response regulator AtoC
MRQALIVETDESFQHALAEVVRQAGFKTEIASTLKEARRGLAHRLPDVFFVDPELPDGSGLELLDEVDGVPETVLITSKPQLDPALGARGPAVADYLTKPIDPTRVRMLLAKLARNRELKLQIRRLRGELRRLGRFGALVGVSPAMQNLYDLVLRVARTDAPILITGEAGTGKKLVGRTVHEQSLRARGPFVAVACGSSAPDAIERELFGEEHDADGRRRTSALEAANRGTLLLDEVTAIPAEGQSRLVTLFETGRFTRLGSIEPVRVDVRIIATTARDVAQAVAAGQLREELLYRLNVFPIQLPPLRDRAEDVELLAEHFLRLLNRREGASTRFARGALDLLWAQRWPGNVRELRDLVERAFRESGDEIGADAFPPPPAGRAQAGSSLDIGVGTSLEEMERRLILATLSQLRGDKRKAAAALKISLKTLYNRINQYRGAPSDRP